VHYITRMNTDNTHFRFRLIDYFVDKKWWPFHWDSYSLVKILRG
jgi:hypothetical protein